MLVPLSLHLPLEQATSAISHLWFGETSISHTALLNKKLIQVAYGRSFKPQVTVEITSIAETTTMWQPCGIGNAMLHHVLSSLAASQNRVKTLEI